MINRHSLLTALAAISICMGTNASAQGREEVFYLQQKINTLGFDIGQPDGVAGAMTLAAIREIGDEKGFEPTVQGAYKFYARNFFENAKPLEDEEAIAKLNETLEDKLLDPFSAQYKNIVILPSGNICGSVNSKNSYGAYTGYQQFFAMSFNQVVGSKTIWAVFAPIVDDESSSRAQMHCLLDIDYKDQDS
jgi:peptidoglycan hydrolase-like protein with peptidoglycan-binding domain